MKHLPLPLRQLAEHSAQQATCCTRFDWLCESTGWPWLPRKPAPEQRLSHPSPVILLQRGPTNNSEKPRSKAGAPLKPRPALQHLDISDVKHIFRLFFPLAAARQCPAEASRVQALEFTLQVCGVHILPR